ncbi:MAG: hypothetical protein ACO1SX_29020 [Actinomycetota bacterium]
MKQHAARLMATALVASFGLSGIVQAQPLSASTRQIPTDTVVQLQLTNALSSRNAHQGDLFTARLSDRDNSGFPLKTRFEGSVIEARPAAKDRPGVLGIKIHRAFLPDGSIVAVNGTLAGLDEDSVQRRSNGRLEARGKSTKNKLDLKWVGYGAAGGAVLGTVLGDGNDLFKGALLGALGGAAYSYLNKDKDHKRTGYSDVQLARDTDFGIRVHNAVAFRDKDSYRYAAYDNRNDRVYRNGDNRNRDDRYDSRTRRSEERDEYEDRYYERTTERSTDRDRYNDRESDRVNDRDERDTDRYDDRDRTPDRVEDREVATRRPAH